MGRLILYGRGLIAEEYCRYLEGRGKGGDIAAFAVTRLGGQGSTYCSRPCLEIGEALERFPKAEVHLALQEKYHEEVLALLEELGKEPAEIIGLRRMTELLGAQGMEEIRRACPELTVQRCPYDYSTLEVFHPDCPGKKFTFYPMCQVPLREEDLARLREYLQGEVLHIAMATSGRDAKVCRENLPAWLHPVLGGAALCSAPRPKGLEFDDDVMEHISKFNDLYSELTVAYYLWKKAPQAKYLGLCHYRRHFVLTEEARSAMAKGTVDVFLTRPRLTFPSVRAFFTELPVSHTEKLDYETMLDFITKEDGKLAAFAKDFLSRQVQFPNSMVIAKREIYLSYCKFLFSVLQGMQAYYEEKQIKRPARYLGNVGEMLTMVYFACHRDKWRTEYLDYRLLE